MPCPFLIGRKPGIYSQLDSRSFTVHLKLTLNKGSYMMNNVKVIVGSQTATFWDHVLVGAAPTEDTIRGGLRSHN
jgi:hypothetical protein